MTNANIKLQSCDGEVFEVDLETARCSKTISAMMMTGSAEAGEKEVVIPLQQVDASTLKKVIEWASHHKDEDASTAVDTDTEISNWDAEFLKKLDAEVLCKLMQAANFLEVNGSQIIKFFKAVGSPQAEHPTQDGTGGPCNDGSGDAPRMTRAQSNTRTMRNEAGSFNRGPNMHTRYPRGPNFRYGGDNSGVPLSAEPLKILVPNDFIGAVIGRGGATIREISRDTGARLDIFRNGSGNDFPEKAVALYGPPEKASKACRRVLEILLKESETNKDYKQEIALRMFAPEVYIGKIIGKGGSVIKNIMEDTQTKVHITQSDMALRSGSKELQRDRNGMPIMSERIVTIKGSIDGMCKAEAIISEKLRELNRNQLRMYERGPPVNGFRPRNGFSSSPYGNNGTERDGDFRQSSNSDGPRGKPNSRSPFTVSSSPNSGNRNNMPQYIPGGTYSNCPSSSPGASNSNGSFLNSITGLWSPDQPQVNLSRPETVNMYIPDDVVGALIGRKGANIRQIIEQTGACVKIMEDTLLIDDEPVRRVVITGVTDALFKAQYLIYDKVVEEGKGPSDHFVGDIGLTVEMSVPSEMVGRLIGKSGQNIREIQKNFFCRIKFMTKSDETLPPAKADETYVRIHGNYGAFLGAQRQIREILIQAMTRPFPNFFGGKRRGDGNSDPRESGSSTLCGSGNASENSGDN